MKLFKRRSLTPKTQRYLTKRQRIVNASRKPVEELWRGSKRTKALKEVVAVLQQMTGSRKRCMYCRDSHGSDIEHFWPKAVYPTKLLEWDNLLLVCGTCNSQKLSQFPLDDFLQPLLIDPSFDNPWTHLDFDEVTGELTPRWVLRSPDVRGISTLATIPHLKDESVTEGRRENWDLLCRFVRDYLNGDITKRNLFRQLWDADHYGLIQWLSSIAFHALPEPFNTLYRENPSEFDSLVTYVR